MTATIIQFVPRPNPNRTAVTMEQQAIGIVDYINGLTGHPEMVPGMVIVTEYAAPEKDPA